MKKLSGAKIAVMAFIVGVGFSFSFTAIADTVSLIGKKFDGEINVTLNGEKLNAKAGIAEGTSYLPVRAVGEALGLKVDFTEKEGVVLSTQDEAVTPIKPTESGTFESKVNYPPEIKKAGEIYILKMNIEIAKKQLESIRVNAQKEVGADESLQIFTSQIAPKEAEIKELERQLQELESSN